MNLKSSRLKRITCPVWVWAVLFAEMLESCSSFGASKPPRHNMLSCLEVLMRLKLLVPADIEVAMM